MYQSGWRPRIPTALRDEQPELVALIEEGLEQEPKERPELLKRAETQIGRLGFQWPPAIIRGAAALGERKPELFDEPGEP